jgi:DNA-binding PadR family transcriptional regulator
LARTKKTTFIPQVRILNNLALNPEIEQFKLPTKIGLSYRTIVDELKKAEQQRLIKLLDPEPSKKGGKEKKIYTITFTGLAFIINQSGSYLSSKDYEALDQMLIVEKPPKQISTDLANPETLNQRLYAWLNQVAKASGDHMPWILGKYILFKENKVPIYPALLATCRKIMQRYNSQPTIIEQRERQEQEETFKKYIKKVKSSTLYRRLEKKDSESTQIKRAGRKKQNNILEAIWFEWQHVIQRDSEIDRELNSFYSLRNQNSNDLVNRSGATLELNANLLGTLDILRSRDKMVFRWFLLELLENNTEIKSLLNALYSDPELRKVSINNIESILWSYQNMIFDWKSILEKLKN